MCILLGFWNLRHMKLLFLVYNPTLTHCLSPAEVTSDVVVSDPVTLPQEEGEMANWWVKINSFDFLLGQNRNW